MDKGEEFALEVIDIIRDGKTYDPDAPLRLEFDDEEVEYAISLQGLEEELGILIPDDIAEEFCNLGDVVEFVKKQMDKGIDA
jgi:acyl carrier protein